jgi:ABC-type Fe3+ transport system permease subunit
MKPSIASLLLSVLAFVVGGLIGLAFGAVQQAARRRNEIRQEHGKFSNAWLAMPGSMTRVAFLILALLVIQIGWPVLFAGGSQWMVSAGVVLGYGLMLLKEFRKRYVTPRSRF